MKNMSPFSLGLAISDALPKGYYCQMLDDYEIRLIKKHSKESHIVPREKVKKCKCIQDFRKLFMNTIGMMEY